MGTEQQALIEAIGNSPIAMAVSNPRRTDNPLELVNPAFCALTAYDEVEALGRNCRFLAGPGTDSMVQARIRDAITEKRPVLAELLNYRRDGSPFRNGLMITPLFDAEGQLAWFLGSQVDLGPDDLHER